MNDDCKKQAHIQYNDTVILIRTYYVDNAVLDLIEKLKKETAYRIAIAADERTQNLDPGPGAGKISLNFTAFHDLGLYVEDNAMWKCGDYGLYAALPHFPQAAYFWLIEPDVMIHTEHLSDFFSFFNTHRQVDFLACLYSEADQAWNWRRSMTPYATKIYRCMFSLTRFSRAAVEFMLERRRALSASHVEAIARNGTQANLTWPNDEVFSATELSNSNFICRDINDFGKTFYTENTFGFINPVSLKRLKNTLPDGLVYHPVLSGERYRRHLLNSLNASSHTSQPCTHFLIKHRASDYVQQLRDECGDEAADQYKNTVGSLLAALKNDVTENQSSVNGADFSQQAKPQAVSQKESGPELTEIALNFGNGVSMPFVLREGDSDKAVLQQIFAQRDYDLARLARHGDIRAEFQRITGSGRTPLIIDCGANIGASPVWFSQSFTEAQIFAVEPERHNYEILRRNCKAHQNIKCRNAAISCVNETVYVQKNPGAGSWAFRTIRDSGPSGTAVRAVSIESIEKLFPESELFLVKIDIEGGESRLFESNLEWIDRAMVIIIELHDWMLPGSANSQNCLKALSERRRDFVFFGENVFSIRNDR